MAITININESVKFKLNDYGKDIYYHQFDETNRKAGREVIKPQFPRTDVDGFSEMQLWCFMELYGPYTGMTQKNYLDNLNIVYEPEPEAEWVHTADEDYAGGGKTTCSACNYSFSDKAYHEVKEFDYCPHCGKKMLKPAKQMIQV